jgi:energy-converting hydrogenase Eha subunit E
MSGLLFSALALATLTRMATVATGFNADPLLKSVLQWVPTICWAAAGVALLYLAAARVKSWMAR